MSATVWLSAFVMGLFGGAHCIVMCGAVVGVFCARLPFGARRSPGTNLGHALAYNVGRIASYALAGAVAGGVGALVRRFDALYGLQLGLRVLAATAMIGVGLFLAGWCPRFQRVEQVGAPLWRRIAPLAKRLLGHPSFGASFALGLLWGWMPCGLVYAALGLAIASGAPLSGAITMAAFGLGTLPVLLTMGAFAAAVARFVHRVWVRRIAGLAIVAFGAVNLLAAGEQARWTPALTFGLVHPCCARPR